MKIGISALLYNLKEALEICKEENIAHIEIGIDNLEECNELLTYKDDFNKLDLSIGIHLPMELNACENINHIRKSWVDFVNRINQQLNALDIKYINMHLGYAMTNRLNNNRQKYLDNALKFFNNDNLDKDITITIENTYSNDGDFSNIGNKLKDFEYIFKSAKKDNLYFCYDTGHYLINKDRYLQSLKEKIKVVHISDNDGIKDTHIGIGKGILEKEHIKSVIEIDPEYLILEINYTDIKDTLIILSNL